MHTACIRYQDHDGILLFEQIIAEHAIIRHKYKEKRTLQDRNLNDQHPAPPGHVKCEVSVNDNRLRSRSSNNSEPHQQTISHVVLQGRIITLLAVFSHRSSYQIQMRIIVNIVDILSIFILPYRIRGLGIKSWHLFFF